MAYYTLSMLVMAIVLAQENDVYQDMVIRFLEQFVMIARALERQGLYDAEDAFFYDRITTAGRARPGQGEDDRGPDPAPARHRACPRPRPSGPSGSASDSRGFASVSWRRVAASSGASRSWATGAPCSSRSSHPTTSPGRSKTSSTRTRSCRRTGFGPSRSATRTPPTRSTASPARRSTTSRPSRRRACSAATRTGAAPSGCR